MPRPRDKEPTVAPVTVAPLSWPAGGATGVLPPSISSEPKLSPDELVAAKEIAKETSPKETLPKEASLEAAPVISAPVKATSPLSTPPSARPPFLPLPPRRPITTPSFNFKPVPQRPAAGEPAIGSSAEGAAQPPVALTPAPRPPAVGGTVNAPPPIRPLRPAPPLSPLAPPVAPAQPVETVTSTAPAIVSTQEPEPENVPATADALESLEEEMAKLLGRSTKE